MRIQLNKPITVIEKSNQALLNQKLPLIESIKHILEREAIIVYVCPNCGSELYGYWEPWYAVQYKNENNVPAQDRMNATYFLRNNTDIIKQEIKEIQELKECPFCGGKLSHDKGFYMEYDCSEEDFGLDIKNLANNTGKNSEVIHWQDLSRSQSDLCEWHLAKEYGVTKKNKDDEYELFYLVMEKCRKESEKKFAEQKSQEKSLLFDQPAFLSKAIDEIETIKNTPAKLKEYLQNLIKMEINIYSLSKRLEELYYAQFEANRNETFVTFLPFYEKKRKIVDTENYLEECLVKIEQYKAGNIGISTPSEPIEPIYKTPNFLNKKKIIAENEELKAKYLLEMKEYERQLHEYECQKDKMIAEAHNEAEVIKAKLEQMKTEAEKGVNSTQIVSPASEMKKIIDNEVREAEDLLKKIYECRNSLYSYEIVFGKYRNVVALSTFYEYLMAGRCTTLDGADGAYNLYENQIRADMIIGQLSQVIEKLDDIKDSQYMIYSELQTVNSSLNHLNKTMDTALVSIQNMENDIANISKNTDVIAHNTAVTAHYAKVNAELTNALGFMIALS